MKAEIEKAIDERSYEYSREHQMPREEYLTRLYQIQDEAIKNVEAIKIIFHNQPNPAAHDIQIVLDMAKHERDRRAQPENKPLSLEQVSVMCGEPLYVIPLEKNADWGSHWAIMQIDSVTASSISAKSRMYFLYEKDYGKTWIAYKFEPKQEEK